MNRIKEIISLLDCMNRMPSTKKGDDWTAEHLSLLNELDYLRSKIRRYLSISEKGDCQ